MLIHVWLHPIALKEWSRPTIQRLLHHMGYDRQKGTNAMIARSRSKRQRHDPPTAKRDNPCANAAIRRGDSGSSAAVDINTPLRRIRPPCCARAANGHVAAAPPSNAMNSRRLMGLSLQPRLRV